MEPFSWGGTVYNNVVATLPGKLHPEQVYIVGAHYDSVGNPGADDNASGTAGVVEAARVLSQYQFDRTIKFIAFDREEQGLIGSKAYVGAHGGDDVEGMISMDMIAYNTGQQNRVEIHGRPQSNAVMTGLRDSLSWYGNGVTAGMYGPWDASDQAPFEWQGQPACLMIESWGNPYYHTAMDSVDTPNYIDYTFAVNVTRGAIGYLATAAGLEAAAVAAQGSWVSNTTYTAAYGMRDANVVVGSVDIDVTGTCHAIGNLQTAGHSTGIFGIDTHSPPPGALPRAALADAVLSSGALNLRIGTSTTPTDQQSAINPVDQALALTGTWLEV